jgi:hypothetical protein
MEAAPDIANRIDSLSGVIDKFREQAEESRAKDAARQNTEQVRALITAVCAGPAKRDLNAIKLHQLSVKTHTLALRGSPVPAGNSLCRQGSQ